GQDYPELYVSSNPYHVGMVAEETVNFAISSPEAMEQWATSQVGGGGFLRLGSPYRGFAIPMFHSLHCMRLMRYALDGQYSAYARGHMQHCLNYLRQEILCASDVAVEPADILQRDYEEVRFGSVHVCKDWEALFADAEKNWDEWEKADIVPVVQPISKGHGHHH
ncbi:hypothetical protein FA15DRAFT_592771, partial [Coprinopsis marcescibilis]